MQSFIAGALGCLACVFVTGSDSVTVTDNNIRVGDVVNLESLEPSIRDEISQKIIAAQPSNSSHVKLKRSEIQALVRRRVPGLTPVLVADAPEHLTIKFPARPTETTSQNCYSFAHSVPAGQAITQKDLAPEPCDRTRRKAPMRYDRATAVLRAARPISAMAYAGNINVPAEKFADIADPLVLHVAIGPVQIEKDVWALQPANGADHIFVEDKAGNILRVPVANPNAENKSEKEGAK